jgi:hypothetical protein
MASGDDLLDRMTWALQLFENTGVYNLPFSQAASLLKNVGRLGGSNAELETAAVDDAKDILYAADKSGGNINVPTLISMFQSAANLSGHLAAAGGPKRHDKPAASSGLYLKRKH